MRACSTRLLHRALHAAPASLRAAAAASAVGLGATVVANHRALLLPHAPALSEAAPRPATPLTAPYLTANFIADAAAKASPALVNIRVEGTFHQASGSGFIVDASGLILTNTHVVDAARGRSGSVKVTLSDGVTELRGVVQQADALSDVAIVRVQPSKPLPTVRLGTSAHLRPGEFVVALGAPAGLTNSVSAGIVSAVARQRSEIGHGLPRGGSRVNAQEYIQTDAAINQGNSGGPLLNLQGEVIGVNTMKISGTDGIAFALPIDDVKRVVDSLQRHGRVLRPYLGLKFVELDATIAGELRARARGGSWSGGGSGGWGLGKSGSAPASPPDAGLYVMHVTPDSPAHRAGVRVGDTLTRLGDSPLTTTKALVDGLQDTIGRQVALDVERGGAEHRLAVTPESMQ